MKCNGLHESPLLCAALDYRRRGWSVIPLHAANKLPAIRWKKNQDERAAEPQLLKWFDGDHDYGIAVVFGDVSGGLASRDFDTLESYQRWASNHPDLAATLPTVATSRGRHVYFIAPPDSVQAVRDKIGKPLGRGAIALADGELRCGASYSALPPSRHPSGHVYRWLVPLPDGDLPEVDLLDAGFVTLPTPKVQPPFTESTLNTNSSHEIVFVSDRAIVAAIEATLPAAVGERHRRIFDFARELKALLPGAPAAELVGHVRRWHAAALRKIGTREWDATWLDFMGAWQGCKPAREPLKSILDRADAAEPPDVALAFDNPALRRLIALCRELQRTVGDKPFALACRPPAKLLGVDHDTVAVWLHALCNAGVLYREALGDFARHRAAEYRYLAPL